MIAKLYLLVGVFGVGVLVMVLTNHGPAAVCASISAACFVKGFLELLEK